MNPPNPKEIGIVVALILVIGGILAAIAPELLHTSNVTKELSATQTALAITLTAVNKNNTDVETSIEAKTDIPSPIAVTATPQFINVLDTASTSTAVQVPTSTNAPIATEAPLILITNSPTTQVQNSQEEFITVDGNAENGITWTCPQSAEYTLSVQSGTYDGWPGTSRYWRSVLHIYLNRNPERGSSTWGSQVPINQDGIIGIGDFSSQEIAEANVAGSPQTVISCQSGQYLHFLPIDSLGAYTDNQGSVVVRISY